MKALAIAMTAGLALAGIALLAANGAKPADEPALLGSQPSATPSAVPTGAAGNVQRTGDPIAAPPVDRSDQLELPDGSFVTALNGAHDAAPIGRYWGPYPWSPIVGVERSSAGLDWYRHADGSYSTTQMVWRQDLGREAAMTRVAHPGPTPAPAAGP
jgi:hypothetical protein